MAAMSPALGGAELHALDLARRLARRGHEVSLMVRPGDHPVARAARATALPVWEAGTYPAVAAWIDRVRPDVVQHFDAQVVIAGLQAATHRSRSVQVVHANHALQPNLRPTPLEDADVVVAVSASAARFAPQGGPPPRVVWSGVDVERFRPAGAAPPDAATRLLFVGRVDEAAKRCSAVLEACRGLSGAPWRLELVGDGPDAEGLAARLGPQEHLRTRVADVAQVYRGADVLVSASPSEGFGQALAEAMASGLAVVARRCHGLTERLVDGRHALLADDDEGLGRQLARVHRDPELRAALGAEARRFAEAELCMSTMVLGYEAAQRAAMEAHA